MFIFEYAQNKLTGCTNSPITKMVNHKSLNIFIVMLTLLSAFLMIFEGLPKSSFYLRTNKPISKVSLEVSVISNLNFLASESSDTAEKIDDGEDDSDDDIETEYV